jgi:hypothetical protein
MFNYCVVCRTRTIRGWRRKARRDQGYGFRERIEVLAKWVASVNIVPRVYLWAPNLDRLFFSATMSDTGSDSDDGGISRTRHLPPEDADGDGDMEEVNLNINDQSQALPPLSLSILGVEPIDEFIREVADFISHMITTKPDHLRGSIEVEAKVGILRDRNSGQRLSLPVLVESSTH